MGSFVDMYTTLLLSLWVYMTLAFLYSVVRRRNDVADIAWGLGFLIATIIAVLQSGHVYLRTFLVLTLVGVWALRLSVHIYLRNRGKNEDYRYAAWRKQWGRWFLLRSYLQVFVLQGILLLVVVSPAVITVTHTSSGWGLLDLVGLFVWCFGFYFEARGDWQLTQFLADPTNKGKVMQTGLWRYTRHPNYFGEVTQWWGIWIIALSVPFGWVSFIGPLVITLLILKVSGVPLLENKMKENPEFQDYMRRTSMFIPWPPKE